MTSLTIGLISTACIFGGALLGMSLRRVLPGHHLDEATENTVRLGAGMIATLTALVLGLLVSSAKSSFDVMNAGITQGSAKIIMLDRTLAAYGPDAKEVREDLRHAMAAVIEMVWPKEGDRKSGLMAYEWATSGERFLQKLRALKPVNDEQRQLLAQALQLGRDMTETRWLIIEQAQASLPMPFLVVLLFWLIMLFVTFGMFAPRNATAISVLLVCALSVSAAIFLILEMNRPFAGTIEISDAPMRKALEHLGQ